MNHNLHLTQYSNSEDSIVEKCKQVRDRFFHPAIIFFTKVGIKANHFTFLSLAMMVPFVFFLNRAPIFSLVSLLVSFLFDSMDGSLARYQKVSSEQGVLLDIAVDHLVFFIVLLALIYVKTLDGFFGAAYSLNYLLMVVLVMLLRARKLPLFTVIRNKYYFYVVWALFVLTGWNFLDAFLLFFSIYMFLTNIFLFHKLRCSIQS